MIIEVCTQSLQGCLTAQACGAHRVELCQALDLGGLTPSFGLIENAVRRIRIPVHVLVRPRPGDFIYSPDEIQTIETDICAAAKLGAQAVVCGALLPNGTIDIPLTSKWVAMAHRLGMRFTFHRAFDLCPDPIAALKAVIAAGADILLTSGGAPTALQGLPNLTLLAHTLRHGTSPAEQQDPAANPGRKPEIMPGAGINASNAMEIAQSTGCTALHLSAGERVPSPMQRPHLPISFTPAALGGDAVRTLTSPAKLKAVVALFH